MWISKEETSKVIGEFRTISLLDPENNYVHTSVQKGRLELLGVMTQLLIQAKEVKDDLILLWLDLARG